MDGEVTCLGCGTRMPAAGPACEACGKPVQQRCGACAQPVHEAFRYCPGCGEGIATDERRVALASSFRRLREQMPAGLAEKVLATRGRIEGERKQVTVLFCDVVSSAALAEDMDPDAPLFGEGLGLDSLDALELALAVSKTYGFQLRSDDANNLNIFASLRALSQYIESHRLR